MILNNSNLKGSKASMSLRFGRHSRYEIYAVHTRFKKVQWFVLDHDKKQSDGTPTLIRQDDCFDNAIKLLNTEPLNSISLKDFNLT